MNYNNFLNISYTFRCTTVWSRGKHSRRIHFAPQLTVRMSYCFMKSLPLLAKARFIFDWPICQCDVIIKYFEEGVSKPVRYFSCLLVVYQKITLSTAQKVAVLGVFLVCVFPHSDWIWRDMEYVSVFNLNSEKHGPEKPQIWKLFTYRSSWWPFKKINFSRI